MIHILRARLAPLVLVGALLALLTPVGAEPLSRDWFPAGLTLPEGGEVLMDQKIGSRTYILQVETAQDPRAQFPHWEAALIAQGLDVQVSLTPDARILFSGGAVESGMIAVLPGDSGGFILQIDLSQAAP